ncbi:protein-L-isoaspartate O-methyltransferase [Campylobacterota bacterium]|nr:protein-L-isoaspartate O-methyltransferase [Campylobacterota bacterium]
MAFNAQSVFADALSRALPISSEVKKAFETVDRSAFIPQGLEKMTYELNALPISANQWISSPLTVAKMTEALQPQGADNVLEIGCGSGYQAAILSVLVRRVFSVERIEKLLREANERFRRLRLTNISTRLDDAGEGWSSFAPYDRVLISCECAAVPRALTDQLAAGGILVAPRGGQIVRMSKSASGMLRETTLGSASFVPMLSGIERM